MWGSPQIKQYFIPEGGVGGSAVVSQPFPAVLQQYCFFAVDQPWGHPLQSKGATDEVAVQYVVVVVLDGIMNQSTTMRMIKKTKPKQPQTAQ
mmetsp:Transcript_123222/g.241744  ORF Transcript_123222/g.241744 Transcript_123222/m.241744 type:complete len:92 (+) Transcript_123222:520-795(+)